MRRILMLGCSLAGGFMLVGCLVDTRMFVLAAYIGVLFVPVLVVAGLYSYVTGGKGLPKSNNQGGDWPPSLRPRKPFRDVM